MAYIITPVFTKLQSKWKEKFMIVRYLTKPFLMPLLLLFYVIGNVNINWLISSAIIGGFVGDIFLMLPDPEKTRKWLRVGLVSFLFGYGTIAGILLLYLGAWLFAVSDTINGYVKFVNVFKYERVITMFTYIAGQLMIVLGVIFL